MKVVFTLCSNNYLGAAKVLIDSLKIYHLDFVLYIGLVDKLDPSIDYSIFDCAILPVDQIPIPDLSELSSRFNIVELNTTVKPFYFKYFFFKLNAAQVIYLDPDIKLFSYLDEVMKGLQTAMITLTPHMLSPVDDEFGPNDVHVLPSGIFNLGFIALSKQPLLDFFLDWWSDRCFKYGYRSSASGLFYDQVWINYVPAFFESYYVIRHPGYNVANWNLHERKLSKDESGKWWVNETKELAFFHFSHYNINKPEVISSYNTRFNLQNRPDLAPVFNAYYSEVVNNNGLEFKKLIPHYKQVFERAQMGKQKKQNTFKQKTIGGINRFLNRIIPDW
jgi:hypothetical protein